MTVAGSTGNMDDKVMGRGHDLFLVCFHVDNNAFHCKQSKDCFSRVPRRLENILEIERTLYLESEAPGGGGLALVITRRVTLGSHLPSLSLSFLTQKSY